MNFFHHKDLGNHLLQLCPKVVKHPVEVSLSTERKAMKTDTTVIVHFEDCVHFNITFLQISFLSHYINCACITVIFVAVMALFLIFLQIYPNEYSMFLKHISPYKILTPYPNHCYSSITSAKVTTMILMNTGNLKDYNNMMLIYIP